MRTSSAEPHHAGGPGSKKVAEFILSKYESWGLEAWIEEHEAYMPMPTERLLELIEPEFYRAELAEPAVPEDKDTADPGQLPTFNAYSADGDVTGELVYVNYGIPEDYERLEEMGIDVRGKIAIVRYGRSWRGIKAKMAQEHGAIGCLIYSDPREDGYYQGDAYPEGPYRPRQGVQRGSVMDMPIHPGDPLTPGWGAEKGGKKLDVSEAKILVKIPVLPISYGDAIPLMKNIRGPVAPSDWRGALPLTYHVGPGPAKARLKLAFEWKMRPLYNVLARIEGAVFPDEWILQGNHHDAWVNGASDPTSGNVALMETARAMSVLLKQGLRPKRTIIFASWDGEEWGLLGSTEWVEKHAAELREKAVVYINTDSNRKGWLSAGGSHSLQKLVNDVARDIRDPVTDQSVWEAARKRRIDQADSDEEKKKIREEMDLPISALGSGSDYTAFLDHLNIASLNISFGGAGGGGVGHSIYDTFAWYTRFADSEFEYGRTLSQTIGTTLLRVANATVLPFHFADYADTLGRYIDEVEEIHEKTNEAPDLDLKPLRSAVDHLRRAGESYEAALAKLSSLSAGSIESQVEFKEVNRLLYTSERLLGHEGGLPHREWFRHQIYAPGFFTGYGVKTLPGIREGVEEKAWADAARYVSIVSQAVDELASQVEEARRELEKLIL
jgi:N-acetylated-alpha-linked acidic dipeptidase